MSELRKKIHDDNNGLDYVLVGDYYLPVLSLPEETRPIGCWGMLRKEYLKEHKSGMYIAGTVICSRKRKNKYSAKAGRRYCSGKSQRCAVR